MAPSATQRVIRGWLESRLPATARAWLEPALAEIARGVSDERLCALVSLASRHVPRRPLAPNPEERAAARAALDGFEPERWSLIEAARVALVLSRAEHDPATLPRALEEAFRYADEGELCALHRSLAHMPGPERFRWRAGEGCRSNMRSVFEAAACDTPYPCSYFDELAWRQCLIKCLFVGAPLWRIHGVDARLDGELARMALDLADERRSAGRPVPHELWWCLGKHAGERGTAALERELAEGPPPGRRSAAFGLARAGEHARLRAHATREQDAHVQASLREALAGDTRVRELV